MLHARRPVLHIMENVPEICDAPANMQWLSEQVNMMGYVMAYDVLNAKSFGVPQSRNRWWAVVARTDAFTLAPHDLEAKLREAFCVARSLGMDPEPLKSFLLDDTD
eukprot:9324249-Alexandrium_andersonii.AAC.1